MNTNTPPIIGLTGRAGSGKDTVREQLVQCHGYTGMALADPIRAMLRALLVASGTGPEWMTDRALKEQPIPAIGASYRHLAQTLGTEWGRFIAPELWLRIADGYMRDIQRETFCHMKFVISDVRFPNEAEWVRSQGGEVWHINRPGVEPVRAHTSESIEQIAVDRTVNNTGTLEDLAAEVARVMGEASADKPYTTLCTCDLNLTPEELDFNKCSACGKAVLA